MVKVKVNKDAGRRPVKLRIDQVERVEQNKKKTGVPICIFIEQAIDEKFQRELEERMQRQSVKK